ncbi:Random slug protein 5 [Ananas comosus]|uniref:Random slug protein 5 n=1 Tax=Ananas comosus TaxID=4615 RepID=A0A199UYE8_ANACO|nr:Random slug protein 5 [Ananas comosus]
MWRKKHGSHGNQEHDIEQQEAKIKELRAAIGPLSGRSSKYCSEACLRRYLEARNWNVDKSRKMLEESLKWRSTFKPEEIRWPEVAVEGETGKIYRANFHDRQGRINTTSHENQLRHLVYLLENAVLNLPEGQEQMVWLIDFRGWSLTNSVPIKTARETANILQNHYPERLAISFLYDAPRVFEAFWKVVKYFLDQKTFQKVTFVYSNNEESKKLLHKHFDPETLPVEFGGENKTEEYDHDEFSKMMTSDDMKFASFWALEETNGAPNDVCIGHSASREVEVASEPSYVSAQAN